MKRLIKLLFLFSLLGILAGGCELFQGVKWDEGYYYTFTIDPAEAGEYGFKEEAVPTDIQKVLDDNNVKENKLKSVVIKEIKATIQSNSHESNFNLLEDGKITMHGEGMSPVDVAWWPGPAPQNVSSVLLDHTSNELKDHILSGTLYFSGFANLKAAHEGTTYVRVDVQFELNGKIL